MINKLKLWRIKIIVLAILAMAVMHKANPEAQIKAINAPYSGTCIITRNLEIHQQSCMIQPNNIALIAQR